MMKKLPFLLSQTMKISMIMKQSFSRTEVMMNIFFAYPCEEQRLEMLCRFYVEQGESVPPFLKEIKQRADELGELFDEMIEG